MTMNLPVSIEQLSPAQLDLLQNQIMQRQHHLLQQTVEKLAEKTERLEAELEIKSAQLETMQHRVDNVDLINYTGDHRQRVNRMVNKVAFNNRWTHKKAWSEFKGAMNMSYRMNIQSRYENFMLKNGKCTMPEFLEATGLLEDAIRVLDKMINHEIGA